MDKHACNLARTGGRRPAILLISKKSMLLCHYPEVSRWEGAGLQSPADSTQQGAAQPLSALQLFCMQAQRAMFVIP